MHPELFEIPILHVTVKSYGLMMVVAFLAAVAVIRYLSRRFTEDPQHITNAALYSLVAGVVGARMFFIAHYFEEFRDDWLAVVAIWNGGLELLGGVLAAVLVIVLYIRHHKLPMRHYLDVLAIGLTVALFFGRFGCFLNGCCYGRPAELPWAVQFPYGSFAYRSQIKPNLDRGRAEPHLHLPDEYFGYTDEQGQYIPDLKPFKYLTLAQKERVTTGEYACLSVHPTQLYTSGFAAVMSLILYGIWRRSRHAEEIGRYALLSKPGSTFSLMFVLYGIIRFYVEMLRDDNPFEIDHLTISQLLSVGLAIVGVILIVCFAASKPEKLPPSAAG